MLLSIPANKTDDTLVGFLAREQMQAILDAPDPSHRDGVRDRAMLQRQTRLRCKGKLLVFEQAKW